LLKIALLGCGRIGKMHAATIDRAPNATLAVVFDPITDAANQVAAQFKCPVAATAEEAIAQADAVLIATSTPTHADLIEKAIAADKAVFCEKPIDLSLERVLACKRAISGSKLPIQIGFNRRFDPGHRAARDAARAGEIGDIQQVIITSRDPGFASRDYIKASGGILRDMTIHDFDLARYMLAEEPVEVFATGSAIIDPTLATEFGDVDSVMVVMKTATGKLCSITNSRVATYGYDQRVELLGSKGMVISGNRRPHELQRFGGESTGGGEPYLNFFIERYTEAFAAGLESFIAAAISGSATEADFDDGVKALALAEAAVVSLKENRSVSVSEILK
jgi:myo-inositol 2-dehydrogenase/D-chiro-inositol 1-dehydrogenase